MVDGVVGVVRPGEDQLRDGDEGVPVPEQGLQDAGQGLRGVEGRVVEEHDGAGLHPGGDPLGDLAGGEVLPVQAVTFPNSFKPVYRGGLGMISVCVNNESYAFTYDRADTASVVFVLWIILPTALLSGRGQLSVPDKAL